LNKKALREIRQSENVTCFEQTKTNCCHRGTIDFSFPALYGIYKIGLEAGNSDITKSSELTSLEDRFLEKEPFLSSILAFVK